MARLKSNIVNDVQEEVLKRINNYHYSSNDIITELALANELNVSRTPVREALLKLIDLGILERTKTKIIVKPISFSDIKEILELREAIELMCVKLIVKNGGLSKDELIKLSEINNRLESNVAEGDFSSNFANDCLFHELMVEYAKNNRLVNVYARNNIQSERIKWLTLLTPNRYSETCNEHKKIIQFLSNKDIAGVSKAIIEHIDNSKQNYKAILTDSKWSKILNEFKMVQS